MKNQIFETIEPQTRPGRWARPQATMNARGFIKINRVAFELLGEPDRIHVLYDRAGKTIALKASDNRDYNAHVAIAHGRNGKHGGRMIRVRGLIEHLEGDIFTCVRFHKVRLDEHNRLVLDLKTATPAFNGQRIGVYQKWYAKNREKINEYKRDQYTKKSEAQAAKKSRESKSKAHKRPKGVRGHRFV